MSCICGKSASARPAGSNMYWCYMLTGKQPLGGGGAGRDNN